MKFADVHRYWVRKRYEEGEKPTISPLRIGDDGRPFVQYDYVHMGSKPPLGFVVGEFYWDDKGVLQLDLWPLFEEIKKKYGI